MFDNGSVSGRGILKSNFQPFRSCFAFLLATPNLSGRDTPSSHISLDSSDRRTTSTNNPHGSTQDSVMNSQATTNTLHNPLAAAVQRGPALPIVVQKPFREDVPDKFNLFDLPEQRPTLEAGIE